MHSDLGQPGRWAVVYRPPDKTPGVWNISWPLTTEEAAVEEAKAHLAKGYRVLAIYNEMTVFLDEGAIAARFGPPAQV